MHFRHRSCETYDNSWHHEVVMSRTPNALFRCTGKQQNTADDAWYFATAFGKNLWMGVWGWEPRSRKTQEGCGILRLLETQGRKRNPNPNCLVRVFSGGVGVFHVNEWGPKSSVCPSKPGKSTFWGGISRDFAPEKVWEKKFVFDSRPLETPSMYFRECHWMCIPTIPFEPEVLPLPMSNSSDIGISNFAKFADKSRCVSAEISKSPVRMTDYHDRFKRTFSGVDAFFYCCRLQILGNLPGNNEPKTARLGSPF